MTSEDVYNSHDWFQNYTSGKFEPYLESLISAAKKLQVIVREDEQEVWSKLIVFPRGELNVRSYHFWHIHPACVLLEADIRSGLAGADEMEPKDLWGTRVEYQTFPELVFFHHVHQEERRQCKERGHVMKRNKKARKIHEDEKLLSKRNGITSSMCKKLTSYVEFGKAWVLNRVLNK